MVSQGGGAAGSRGTSTVKPATEDKQLQSYIFTTLTSRLDGRRSARSSCCTKAAAAASVSALFADTLPVRAARRRAAAEGMMIDLFDLEKFTVGT
jgi:hypothetical protein